MKTITAILGSVGLSVVLAGPVYAQTTNAAPGTGASPAGANATAAPGITAPAPASASRTTDASAPNGSLEKYHDKWRASKLVGSNVYNQGGQAVGSIDDLLIGDDGKISDAVVSVGGFLGIGGKLVSVPFEQFKFEESRRNNALDTSVAPPTDSTGMVAGPAAPAPATNTTMPVNSAAREMNGPERVYFSVVLPNATKNSLSSAAEFKYSGS